MRSGTWSLLVATSALLAACGGGGSGGGDGPQGTDDVVMAAISPGSTVIGYVGETLPVRVTFTTNDGASAKSLSLASLAMLPPGWTSSSSSLSCATVATGTGCSLQLNYAPTVTGTSSLTLRFTYDANDGTAKSGSFTIGYTARNVTLHLLSGSTGGPGTLDGQGTAARLDQPAGGVIDSSGNLFLLDGGNAIRKITPNFVVTTLVRATANACFTGRAHGLAIDAAGTFYIADGGNNTICKVTPQGEVSTLAGSPGVVGSADGTGADASFNDPEGIAVDGSGTVYVADRVDSTIRKITPQGVVTTFAGAAGQTGSNDGTGAAARFWYPSGIAVNGAGTVYVSDTENSLLRQITPQGVVTTLAGNAGVYSCTDATGTSAGLALPGLLSLDGAGNLYLGSEAAVREVTPQGAVTTLAGVCNQLGTADGTGSAARFYSVSNAAVTPTGLLVSDGPNNTLRKVTFAGVVTTVVGEAAPFPGGPLLQMAVGPDGDVYYLSGADIVRVTSQGAATTVSITGNIPPLTGGLAVGTDGMMYAAGNAAIYKITPQGSLSTLAGGTYGYADSTGPAAEFEYPQGLAVDSAGNVYVADSSNCAIRTINPAGVVKTLAGGGPNKCGFADGTGSAAALRYPMSIALDAATGNLYVAEDFGLVRKVTPQGVVTTLVSNAGLNFQGSGVIAFDPAGKLYLADTYNHEIRVIMLDGSLSTVIGHPEQAGIALDPLPASLSMPTVVAVLPGGQLAILDSSAVLETSGL